MIFQSITAEFPRYHTVEKPKRDSIKTPNLVVQIKQSQLPTAKLNESLVQKISHSFPPSYFEQKKKHRPFSPSFFFVFIHKG